jgi:RimJ/RimL family protein N-acetyltransferase
MQSSPFTLRRFLPSDWEIYRKIRLEALMLEPHFFGSGYEQESQETEEQWRSYLSHPVGSFWGLFHYDDCIGVTGIWPFRNEKDTLLMRGSYIRSDFRGRGLSSLFYRERLTWARDHGYKRILVSHREGNDISRAVNQKFGFKYTHTEYKKWPDGKEESHIFYELTLTD